jgi:hypothetical protein
MKLIDTNDKEKLAPMYVHMYAVGMELFYVNDFRELPVGRYVYIGTTPTTPADIEIHLMEKTLLENGEPGEWDSGHDYEPIKSCTVAWLPETQQVLQWLLDGSTFPNDGYEPLSPGDAIYKEAQNMEPTERALDVIFSYGGIDGSHHKQWVLDQVVRALTGEKYEEWVKKFEQGEDGPNTYSWDTGTAP